MNKITIVFFSVFLYNFIFNIDDSNCQWINVTNNISYTSIYTLANNGNKIFAGSDGGGIYYSTNYGLNWIQSGLNGKTVLSLAINGNNIFAGTYYSGYRVLYRSTNLGSNWEPTTLNQHYVFSILFKESDIFAGISDSGLYISTNNGTNWSQTELKNLSIKSLALKGSTIVAGTSDSGIYCSTNNGNNWIHSSLNNKTINAIAINNDYIYAGTMNYGIYYSSNNGINWLQTSLNDKTVHSIIIKNNNIFVGTYTYPPGGIVYLSTNNGVNWIFKNQGFNAISSICGFSVLNDYIFVGINSGGIWRRLFSEAVVIKQISNIIPSEYLTFQNYPNPFNPSTNIKYQITNNKLVTLKIFDIMGREVEILVNEKQSPGTYEANWDASNYPSGVYFYKIQAGDFSETKRMILIK